MADLALPRGAGTLIDSPDITPEELQLAVRNHSMPLEALRYDLTPVGLHYLLIHFDIPAVDPTAYGLTGSMQAFTDSGRIQNSGIENLQLQGVFNDVPTNELSSLAANFSNCKNCWMRNVTASDCFGSIPNNWLKPAA